MVLDSALGTDGVPGAGLYGIGTNWCVFHGDGKYKAILTNERE